MDKQPFTTKLYEVCSTDELRPILMCVHFKYGYAYASDANILIKQSLEYHSIINPELLEDKCIHKDNYKAIMQFEKALATMQESPVRITMEELHIMNISTQRGAATPDFEAFLKPKSSKALDFIGINPELLHKLSKAIHAPSGILRLRFQGLDLPVLVDVVGIYNQMGIIMPAVLQDTLFK